MSASLAAYVGLRHIVVHLDGGERRVRLHVEGHLTLPSLRRATDRLADRLIAWKAASPAALSTPLQPDHSRLRSSNAGGVSLEPSSNEGP